MFGAAGKGKTSWSNNYCKELGYSDNEICYISPSSMTYNEKIYFSLEDELCKVLIINEVDRDFPRKNNLISLIDKAALLPTKGSLIRNNFNLIIVNSVYRPEFIFNYLTKEEAEQVLRRIFNSHTESMVYHLTPNNEQLKLSKSKDFKKMSDSEFSQ